MEGVGGVLGQLAWLLALVLLGFAMYRGLQMVAGRATQGVDAWALAWHRRCADPQRLAVWEASGDTVSAGCLLDFARGSNLAEAAQVSVRPGGLRLDLLDAPPLVLLPSEIVGLRRGKGSASTLMGTWPRSVRVQLERTVALGRPEVWIWYPEDFDLPGLLTQMTKLPLLIGR